MSKEKVSNIKRCKEYKVIYKWVLECLNQNRCVICFLPVISLAVHHEDYEAAQAIKDAIVKYCKDLGIGLPDNPELKIPPYQEEKIAFHLSVSNNTRP